MAEYYSNSISRKRRRQRKHYSGKEFAIILLDVVVSVLMLALIAASVIAIICQYISPAKCGALSIVALGAPVIYLLDIVTMFYWIVRWRWYRAVVMMAVVVTGLFYLSRYYKFELDRKYDTSFVERHFTKVMTYDVSEGKTEELSAYIAKNNPDILCLQGVVEGADLDLLYNEYNTPKNSSNNSVNQIFTRYKIIRSGEINELPRRSGIWADLRVKDDTVRVVALHLQSMSVRPDENLAVEADQEPIEGEREERLRSVMARLVENSCRRAEQAEVVAQFLNTSPYTTLVCGSLNDVPLSYTYNTITEGLEDAFSRGANGFIYTYNTRYGLWRMDNIFVSPWIEVVSYEVDNKVQFSDHFPVVVRVKFNKTL